MQMDAKKYIVGLNLPVKSIVHESGVCLLNMEGQVLWAINEERLSRVKFDGRFPHLSVEEMYRFTGIKPEDVAYVCIPVLPPFKKALRYLNHQLHTRARDFLKPRTYLQYVKLLARESRAQTPEVRPGEKMPPVGGISNYQEFIAKYFPNAKIQYVDHHIAHLASAYFTSPWGSALGITLDGSGSLRSSIIAEARNGVFRELAYSFYPHSLGSFWGDITRACGFRSGYRHGGKTTGLAAFGDASVLREHMRKAVWLEKGQIHRDPNVRFASSETCPDWNVAGVIRGTRENIAAAAQERLAEVATELVAYARGMSHESHVVAGGGVFANVLMNQKIRQMKGVDDLYIVPAMSDGGLAIGAALYTLNALRKKEGRSLAPQRIRSVSWGPSYTREEIESALHARGLKYKKMQQPAADVARLVHANKIVALFQGRMEWGPRALGNRSIMYAPIDPEVNNWLNERLRRSEFMPFAPVTLMEYAKERYQKMGDDPIAATFMTITYDCTERMKKESPACVHIDGTARPQIIRRDDNPYYYDIVDEYRKLSGVPTLINTSFNMHEEPIVCTPQDAVKAFLDSRIDYLVLEDLLVSFEDNVAAADAYRAKMAGQTEQPNYTQADMDPTL